MKGLTAITMAVIAVSAQAQTNEEQQRQQALTELAQPSLKTEKKWTLTISLIAESKDFESVSVGSNEIHGLPSYKKCMQLGFKISTLLNEAVSVSEEKLKQETPSRWGCREDHEVLTGQY